MVSSVFDPLGILVPIILPVKEISVKQVLCQTKHGWDDSMPETLAQQWHHWVMSLQKLANFKVERCVKLSYFGETSSAQLHHFTDASKKG